MTLATTALRSALRTAILSAGSNTNVIFFFPGGPRPQLPYTTIQYLTESEAINDWTIYNGTSELNESFGFREVIFTINCYGSNSLQEASQIKANITKQTIRDALRSDVPASIQSVGGSSNTTVLVDTAFEQRATIDIVMLANIVEGETDNTGHYDTVNPVTWTNEP